MKGYKEPMICYDQLLMMVVVESGHKGWWVYMLGASFKRGWMTILDGIIPYKIEEC